MIAGLAEVSIRKENCPECKKRNSLVHYADGHAVCFTKGCGYKLGTQPPVPDEFKLAVIPNGLLKPDHRSWEPVRSLDTRTLKRYGSFLAGYKGGRELITPVYDNTGVMVAQQVRYKDGTVEVIGERGTGRQLFGQHVFGDRFDRRVVIHSDGLDAMSTGQVSHLRYASVAVLSDAKGAISDLKANYRWLDRFGEIVIFFKNTAEWQDATQVCAALFTPGKVKIAGLGASIEGPSAALQAGAPGDIDSAVWAAATWRPVGVVNAKDGLKELLEEGLQVPSWPFPWNQFNRASLGMRPGEVIYHVGGTGIAKTTLMFHYAVHLMKWNGDTFLVTNDGEYYPTQPMAKVGWMGFEDMTRQVKMGLLSIHAGRRLHLNPVSNDEATRLYGELFGDGKLELYDPETAEYTWEAIKGYIKYMAKALDVRVLYLDPLTFIISMLPSRDRVSAEEAVAAELAALAKNLGICINIGYHLRKADGTPFEEGGEISIPDIKGAGALTHYAHWVLGYERDQQGARPDLLRVRSVKACRYTGHTGVLCILKYDLKTGRYTPTDEEWPDKDDDDKKGFTPLKNNSQDY